MKKTLFLMVMVMAMACSKQEKVWHPTVSEGASRGEKQLAEVWSEADGNQADFEAFVNEYLEKEEARRDALFDRLEVIVERCSESSDILSMILQEPTVQTDKGEPLSVDWLVSGYAPMNHFVEDMFSNRLAYVAILNFPCYTLAEKDSLGVNWSRRKWAEARLGDLFSGRVPGEVNVKVGNVYAQTDNYISGYNVCMGHVLTEDGRRLWGEDVRLLSHWNLRDELKANYTEGERNRERQELVYEVMKSIVRQDIPACVIDNDEWDWMPMSNRVLKNGEEVKAEREKDVRYQQILDCYHALMEVDRYDGVYGNYVDRAFSGDLEMSVEEVERLFTTLVASDEVKAVGRVIKERLGRDLRPYDIWYDGFKARSTMNEDDLTAVTRGRYPDAKAFREDMSRMLGCLGFEEGEANFLQSHIEVDPARGSGHARPCVGRGENARLRTRIAPTGMDYKGYNIAVHEFGHNVEEVISLYHIDHYMLCGIPNTGFTEASAFLFQQRDLQLLGYGKQTMDREATLDVFWGMYEIMGVSLLDIKMWRWLYAHPDANAGELRETVLKLAAEVWNEYYEPVLGEKDCPLLAIYSHMVCYPLYLSAYPIGHLVQFALEEHLAKCESAEDWASEYGRIYRQGRITPKAWMRGAVGKELSVEPILRAVGKALK